MSTEVRPYPPAPDEYRVGSDGSVWSSLVKRGLGWGKGSEWRPSECWRQLRQRLDADGYASVFIRKRGNVKVHRLVLEAFVGPRPPGMACRHLDGNPSNNCLRNLAWGTYKENSEDQYAHGTRVLGERHPMARLTAEQVAQIRSLGGSISQQQISDRFGVSRSCIEAVLHGTTWADATPGAPVYAKAMPGSVVSHRRKLTFAEAEWARAQVKAGVSGRAVARALGCAKSAMQNIINGKTYRIQERAA